MHRKTQTTTDAQVDFEAIRVQYTQNMACLRQASLIQCDGKHAVSQLTNAGSKYNEDEREQQKSKQKQESDKFKQVNAKEPV